MSLSGDCRSVSVEVVLVCNACLLLLSINCMWQLTPLSLQNEAQAAHTVIVLEGICPCPEESICSIAHNTWLANLQHFNFSKHNFFVGSPTREGSRGRGRRILSFQGKLSCKVTPRAVNLCWPLRIINHLHDVQHS